MEKLVQLILKIREDAHNAELVNRHKYGAEDPRTVVFIHIFNHATVTAELFSYYFGMWGPAPPSITDEQLEKVRASNAGRCAEALKYLMIGALSSVEFNIRYLLRHSPEHPLFECVDRRERLRESFDVAWKDLAPPAQTSLTQFRRQLSEIPPFDSIGRVFERSRKLGILTDEEQRQWAFLLTVRNCIVHNNAIADRDQAVSILGEKYELVAGQFFNHSLDGLAILVLGLIPLLSKWIGNFDASGSAALTPLVVPRPWHGSRPKNS